MQTTSEEGVGAPTGTGQPCRWSWLRRTEGRLRLLLVVAVGAGLLVGVWGGLDTRAQGQVLDEIAAHRGPLTAAAEVSRALADADATSAVALLGGTLGSAELHNRYLEDIASANAALSTAAAGSPTAQSAEIIAELANLIPTYTGLIETARADNRQNLLVGAAYLREASSFLRIQILPAAQRLEQAETDQLTAAQEEAAQVPVAGLLLSGALVLWLLAIQVYLRRLTRRLLNIGLLVATLVALTATAWLGIASGLAARHSADSLKDGSRQLEILAGARVYGVLALGDEALGLTIGGRGTGSDRQFHELTTRLTDQDGGLLAQAQVAIGQPDSASEVSAASEVARRWLAVHQQLTDLNTRGDYIGAVGKMIGPGQDSAMNLAELFDEHIAVAAARATERFDAAHRAARDALSGASIGLMVLGGVVVLAAVTGMAPRIGEYR